MHNTQSSSEPNAPVRMLRRRQVEQRTGLARSTIYNYINKGEFPKPYRLGMKTVGWLESEINAWIDGRRRVQD